MTDLDLAAIRERAENATKGPWAADRPYVWGPNDESVAFVTTHDPGEGSGQPEWEANTVFIAHARTDIPGLLDLVDTHVAAVRNASANYLRVLRERDHLAAQLAAVRELHKPVEIEPSDTICGHCSFQLPNGKYFVKLTEWPCPTVTALDAG